MPTKIPGLHIYRPHHPSNRNNSPANRPTFRIFSTDIHVGRAPRLPTGTSETARRQQLPLPVVEPSSSPSILNTPAPTLPRFSFEPPQQSPDVQLNVADIRQKKLNACGDAVVQTVLAYHGLPHSSVGSNDRGLLHGLRPYELGRQLKAQGLQPFGLTPAEPGRLSIEEISQWLRRHGPLIAFEKQHFVVLTGVSGSDVIVRCPLLGRRRMPIDGLNRYLDLTDRRPILATRVATPTDAPTAGSSTSTTQQVAPHIGHRAATRILAGLEALHVRPYESRPASGPTGHSS